MNTSDITSNTLRQNQRIPELIQYIKQHGIECVWSPLEHVLFCHEVFCVQSRAYTEITRVQPNAAAVRAFLGY